MQLTRPTYPASNGIESRILVDNKPTVPLIQLLQKCHIHHDFTLSTIVSETQKTWLAPSGSECLFIEDSFKHQKNELLLLFHQLGLIDELPPCLTNYHGCIVYGSTIFEVRLRFAYALALWERGIRFNKLIFLTGDREIHPQVETWQDFQGYNQKILVLRHDWELNDKNVPNNETEVMKMVYDQTLLPVGFEKVPLQIIDTPKQLTSEGTFRRPNTSDTIRLWLSHNPIAGKYLAISHQPFVGYQYVTMRTLLPSNFAVDTVGSGLSSKDISVTVCLDSLARWLYQEEIYIKTRYNYIV